MSCKFHRAIFHAVLAAALYAVSIPLSKMLLDEVAPTMLAAFLYLGAGFGMLAMGALKRDRGESSLQRKDMKYTFAMARGILIHKGNIEFETFPLPCLPVSSGCFGVSTSMMKYIEKIKKQSSKPILLYAYN